MNDHALAHHPAAEDAAAAGTGSGPFWNEADFNGASLAFSDLAPAGNHYGAAVAFLREGYDRLS